ncbi:MAG: hypothetical protein Q8891_17505 [Bacteroidota bacterium]|nr:hypothetical protein [Bacteroidota bacterium]
MSQPLTITLKETVFNKKNTLVITPESIEYKNTSLSKLDIDEIRHGVKKLIWFDGIYFGRKYCIDIKSHLGTVIRIRLNSAYGIRKKNFIKSIILSLAHYGKIICAMWQRAL